MGEVVNMRDYEPKPRQAPEIPEDVLTVLRAFAMEPDEFVVVQVSEYEAPPR